VSDDGSLCQGGDRGDNKWLDSGYILKAKLRGIGNLKEEKANQVFSI
jgi:hypothetical protein